MAVDHVHPVTTLGKVCDRTAEIQVHSQTKDAVIEIADIFSRLTRLFLLCLHRTYSK
jgi:hypothetical protein